MVWLNILTARFLHCTSATTVCLLQYLGRWWLQDRHSDLADLAGNCWSQVYSVNYVNRTINRQTDYRTPM